ncbi:uncharacterized protein PAC_19753 [Phialocephala subalpina]|uniref:Uncharacterized protein n=1 Tax=Phialocephala subalpina TaxID=576137 RepID=A0A1L7XXQ4_9HELO|nr:uncharacterized protein PAC_19753 [Phialocephala subalpina]
MFNNLFAPLFFSWIGAVAGWTYTNYYTLDTTDAISTTYNIKVYPTGPVTATSTNISTALVSYTGNGFGFTQIYPVTITELFLSPNASVCSAGSISCGSSTTTTSTIDTSYYAPLVISAPSSCTKTSFLYTTSQTIHLTDIGDDRSTELVDQATESSEALFVTTYIYTLSTNLGGQAVTTTRCDVYLSEGAVVLQSTDEAYYLSQCVDPRRYLCTSTTTVPSGSCPTTVGAYPPNGKSGGVSSTGTSVATSSPTSKGGVGGLRALASQGLRLLTLPMLILVFSL